MAATTTHQITITDPATKVVLHNQIVTAPATWTTDKVSTHIETKYRIARRAVNADLHTSATRLA